MEVDFRDIPELQQFVVANVEPTGKKLGVGAYASVEEVKIPGATCAAKKIHDILLDTGSEDIRNISDKFVQECQLMSSLRHPHIVQFLGVCFLPGSWLPALVMERLMMSLGDLLDNNPNISLAIKRSVLQDVASGLAYLHSHAPPIIHRDLTAKNVLLNSALVAKLADLGVARIVDIQPGQLAATMTQTPGTAVYMPPEALELKPQYDVTLDVFSFGSLALYTLTQIFPKLKAPTYIDSDGNCVGRTEVERRIDHIQQIQQQLSHQHPIVQMIERCLHNNPQHRPTVNHILQLLEGVRAQIPDHYGQMSRLEMEQVLGEREGEVVQLQQGVQSRDQELQSKDRELQFKDQELHSKDQELHSKDQELQSKDQELQSKDQQLKSKDQQLHLELQSKDRELQSKDRELQSKNHELHQKNRELELNNRKLQYKHQQLQFKLEEVQNLHTDLDEKVAQISHLQQQLHMQTTEKLPQQGQVPQEEQQGQVLEDPVAKPVPRVQQMLSLIEQLPPAFVTRFTAEELSPHIKKHIEKEFHEWEENFFKFHLFCERPSSGELSEKTLEVHKNQTLGEATERAHKVLELQECGVQLEQCQLVRYNQHTGTLGKPFDEPKDTPLGEVVVGPLSCLSFDLIMETQTDPTTLPRHEQEMRALRVLRNNYSLLWYHLNASKVLPQLLDKSILSESLKKKVESYQQRCGQNAAVINELFTTEHSPEGLLAICDTLQTTPVQEHIAQHILRDYKWQPSLSVPHHTPATTSVPLVSDLSEASLQFQNLQQTVVDQLVQCPNALTQLKQYLASLVLPLGDGKVAPLVNPASYVAAKTIPELFTMMASYWNCLSTKLFSLLLKASGCQPAATNLAEFEDARTSYASLVLCMHRASRGELRSVHTSPLGQLQSVHRPVFAHLPECIDFSGRNTIRISVEVDKPVLRVSGCEEVTTALCGFFSLPDITLVFAGCSDSPLAICWLVSANLLPYMKSHAGGPSGERLLAEQKITQIAIGDAELYKCLNLKEVELHEASYYGLMQRVPDLLATISVDAADYDGWTPLGNASLKGHERVVQLLLAAGANPDLQNKDGWTPLHAASQEGHDRVVHLLIQAGANVEQETEDGWTPLHVASQEGHDRVVHLLIQAGANVEQETEDGQTAFYIAAKKGHTQVAEVLLSREPDANHQNKYGLTPLKAASYNGHQRIVQLLLAAGVNPDLQDQDGRTPLHVASQEGHDRVVHLLIQAGANVEQETEDGRTPLHVASQEGHDRVVHLLIQAGANVEQETEDGLTALFIAAMKGHIQVAKLLLNRGADVTHQTKWGTPLSTAKSRGHEHMVQLLEQARTAAEGSASVSLAASTTTATMTPAMNTLSRLFKFLRT